MLKKTVVRCALFCTVLLLALSANATTVATRTFGVAVGGSLVVDTDIGSIQVSTTASTSVEVVVEGSGRRLEELEVEMSENEGTVTVVGDFPGKQVWGRKPRVRFEISIPREFDIDLRTAGGSIRVGDLVGEARVKTSGGSLDLGEIDGPVWGRTSGGSIRVDGCTQAVDVHTSGGSITIGDVVGDLKAHTSGGSISLGEVGGDIEARTSGGSVRIAAAGGTVNATSSGGSVTAVLTGQPSGDCQLKTSGGAVHVTIAEHLSLDISATCSGGRVNSDLQLTDVEQSKRSLRGALNGGGPDLVLHTSGGGVTIEGG